MMRIDWLSFFIGLLTAILLWVLFRVARHYFFRIQSSIKQRLQEAKKGSLSSLETLIREEAYKRAQRNHCAGIIFTLDEILITPRLFAPPPYQQSNGDLPKIKSITNSIIPYTPDFPELASAYNTHRLTIPESLQNGVNIMLVGEPGEGKSVALAHLASLVSSQSSAAGQFTAFFPLYLHISDLDIELSAEHDPLDIVILALMRKVQVRDKKGISILLNDAIQRKHLLFILDGLDELPPVHLDKAVGFLQNLISRYPQLLIITTAGINYWDGLAKLGFFPMSLATWTEKDIKVFVRNWADKWMQRFSKDEAEKENLVNSQLIISWLTAESKYLSPMEWTLITWGAFAGDIRELTGFQAMDAYIKRISPDISSRKYLEKLASVMISHEKAWIDRDSASQLLNEMRNSGSSDEDDFSSRFAPDSNSDAADGQKSPGRTKATLHDGLISIFIERGLLYDSANRTIGFSSPQIAAYMASSTYSLPDQPSVRDLAWGTKAMTLGFQAALTGRSTYIDRFLTHSHPPLNRVLLTLSRWLHYDPGKANWRKNLLHSMANALNQSEIPALTRARIIGSFLRSNDVNLPALLQQSLKSSNPYLRVLSALASGAIKENRLFTPIVSMVGDPVAEVRCAACMALAWLEHPQKEKVIKEIFVNGDEEMQQALAETLVYCSDEGLELVKSFLKSQDILNRRAAILAIGHNGEDWAKEAIESISIRDGQWMVRSAAAEIFEFLTKTPNPLAPLPLPPVHENPEMILFASKQGFGVALDQDYNEILQQALENGTQEQQQVALQYLQKTFREEIADQISRLMNTNSNIAFKNAACDALWNMENTDSPGEKRRQL
jgi:HEAT repeat protein